MHVTWSHIARRTGTGETLGPVKADDRRLDETVQWRGG
jgi:hypothetical protein